jgi:hypothetical protein
MWQKWAERTVLTIRGRSQPMVIWFSEDQALGRGSRRSWRPGDGAE